MKLDLPSPKRRTAQAAGRPSAARGIALVITLLMLAVITFMAVTFLVLSHRERGAVTTSTDQTTARYAADTALERAKVELLGRMLAFTNDQDYSLIVSTNFINRYGFDPNAWDYRTNVNFDYQDEANNYRPLTPEEALRNLTNLLYNPRPPVYVTNRYTDRNDFRFYLDLNRNGRDDPNGLWPVISPDPNRPYYNATNGDLMTDPLPGLTLSNNFVGDPDWVGVLEHPDQPFSADNPFLSRWAYLVVPAGKALGVNYAYNDAKGQTLKDPIGPGYDGFLRNEGVGTWEMNLAAFLADLNTNVWDTNAAPYDYALTRTGIPARLRLNSGVAFDDASAILAYRYAGSYNNLAPASALFGYGATPLQNDGIDEYSAGPLMLGTFLPNDNENVALSWPGADNPNHLFTMQDYFDPSKILRPAPGVPGFVARLKRAGTNIDSYDRYTFYRMLSQLSTASAPEQDKMNLNYVNVDAHGNVVPGMETNLIPWTPIEFFTNAANRLLLTYTKAWLDSDSNSFYATYGVSNAFGIFDIPVYVNHLEVTNISTTAGQVEEVTITNHVFGYTAGVHRLLQLAANMYDATTNRTDLTGYPYLPSVFEPIFRLNADGDIYITNYVPLNTAASTSAFLSRTNWDLNDPNQVRLMRGGAFSPDDGIYNVPLVIGAKKGFPNFNEFSAETAVQVVRRLQFHKPNATSHQIDWTNQIYGMSISNLFGVELWNSYSNYFPRPLDLIMGVQVSVDLTNQLGQTPLNVPVAMPVTVSGSKVTTIPARTWTNFDQNYPSYSFRLPVLRDAPIETWFTNVYSSQREGFPIQQWFLQTRAHVRYALIDRDTGRIVDYVALSAAKGPGNVTAALMQGGTCAENSGKAGDLWCTNRVNYALPTSVHTPTIGIVNQVLVGLGSPVGPAADTVPWRSYRIDPSYGSDQVKASDRFYFNMLGFNKNGDVSKYAPTNDFMSPFNPDRTIYQTIDLQANDPLVHYTIPDLTDLTYTNDLSADIDPEAPTNRLGKVNRRYDPWGGNPLKKSSPNSYNMAVKDPLVMNSDSWDFPGNKFPNIGWLGRVHRGTPWQTVYLKASDMNIASFPVPLTNDVSWYHSYGAAAKTWADWTGDANFSEGFMSRPVQDRVLFDLFTTSPNENASRGQLSVNQTNLAAWSAVLSGVIAISNSIPAATNVVIEPAGPYDAFLSVSNQPNPMVRIWQGINETRANTNLFPFPKGVFTHLGDVLATPQLTGESPYLNMRNAGGPDFNANDAEVERIPQQILSLLSLSHSPEFVIYAYGQSLKPAPNSIVTSGSFFGLCTNYQVTAESALRAVVRVQGSFNTNDVNNPNPLHRYPPRVIVKQFNTLPPD